VRIAVEISAGELLDRISILELKVERLPEPLRQSVARELNTARALRDRTIPTSARLLDLMNALSDTNRELWDAEDALRVREQSRSFDAHFIDIARRVYLTNDRRAALKRAIDELLGSEPREHKSHPLPDI
jgi:hypothetical protein